MFGGEGVQAGGWWLSAGYGCDNDATETEKMRGTA